MFCVSDSVTQCVTPDLKNAFSSNFIFRGNGFILIPFRTPTLLIGDFERYYGTINPGPYMHAKNVSSTLSEAQRKRTLTASDTQAGQESVSWSKALPLAILALNTVCNT